MKKIKFWLYTGLRYLNSRSSRGNVIFLFLYLGIAFGLMVLIVVIGIINGFQENHISRRIEIGSYHLLISKSNKKKFNLKESFEFKKKLYDKFKEIEAVVPFTDREVILETEKGLYSDVQVIKLRAVDHEEIIKDTRFLKYTGLNKKDLSLSKPYSVILGQALFERVLLDIGDEIFITPDISLRSFRSGGVPFKVYNTFFTNSYDYDRYWAYISIYSLIPLTGKAEIENIGIKLKNKNLIKKTEKELVEFLGKGLTVKNAEDVNKGYFTALKLEKIMIILLFFLIFLLLATNTFGALKLTIIEKKKGIGILKAVGVSPNDIKIIFMIESLILGFIGSFTGIALGLFVAYNIDNIFIVSESIINGFLYYLAFFLEKMIPGIYFSPVKIYDSSIYYQSTFPVLLYYYEVLMICLSIIGMTLLAAYLPLRKASELKPNEIIRNW